jgi:hypothetical protein
LTERHKRSQYWQDLTGRWEEQTRDQATNGKLDQVSNPNHSHKTDLEPAHLMMDYQRTSLTAARPTEAAVAEPDLEQVLVLNTHNCSEPACLNTCSPNILLHDKRRQGNNSCIHHRSCKAFQSRNNQARAKEFPACSLYPLLTLALRLIGRLQEVSLEEYTHKDHLHQDCQLAGRSHAIEAQLKA